MLTLYVADYVIALKKLSATCNFGEFVKQALREIVVGMKMDCHSELAFSAPPTKTLPITSDSAHSVTLTSKHGGRKSLNKMERRDFFKKVECYRCGNDHICKRRTGNAGLHSVHL